MKNKIIMCIISSLFLITTTYAKDSYYYYNGNRIALKLSEDSVCIYNFTRDIEGQQVYAFKTISKSQKSIINNKSNTSVEYMVREVKGNLVRMTNRFYVQLFNPAEDIQLLRNMARKTNTIILGQVPNIPDWYELVVHNSTINNTLEMSNYFYETGLFKDIDPGFVFNYGFSTACVTDSLYESHQWGMPLINACGAWNITKGSSDVKIAIIDGNIYTSHPEFTSTQFVDFYNATTHTSIPDLTYDSHGTMLCGIIAADHNHARIAGIAPDCQIMPISAKTTNTDEVAANFASGIAWAVNHGADVINCSWGDNNGQYQYLHSSLLESTIQNALAYGRNGKGCVVVFASGNQGINQVDYPAYVFPEIITVGAINSFNVCPYFSSYGDAIDIVAPGDNIYSTINPQDTIYYFSSLGTSFSSPYISGIAGLMFSINTHLTRKEVSDIIESTAQKVGEYVYSTHSGHPNGTWNDTIGYGLVDAHAAVWKAAYDYILGPDYICTGDTVSFQLLNVPANAICTWAVQAPLQQACSYSITQGQGTSSIYVTAKEPLGPKYRNSETESESEFHEESFLLSPSLNTNGTISVTVVTSDTTFTVTKSTHSPKGRVPTIEASSSSPWLSGTTRFFTVTNNTSAPVDSLHWQIVDVLFDPVNGNDTSIYYDIGRTINYTPYVPPTYLRFVTISVTNTFEACTEQSSSITFGVTNGHLILSAQPVNSHLNVSIFEETEDGQRALVQLDENSKYTLELSHSIYGLMCSKQAYYANEQIDISSLPQGVYVLLLKENGVVIAQTKVKIQ